MPSGLGGHGHAATSWRSRQHASVSVDDLVRLLFALERRWPPYPDWLSLRGGELAGQGWATGELELLLGAVLASGSVDAQRVVLDRVVALLEARGHVDLLEPWREALARLSDGAGR